LLREIGGDYSARYQITAWPPVSAATSLQLRCMVWSPVPQHRQQPSAATICFRY
jgi:hypothetical protein